MKWLFALVIMETTEKFGNNRGKKEKMILKLVASTAIGEQ